MSLFLTGSALFVTASQTARAADGADTTKADTIASDFNTTMTGILCSVLGFVTGGVGKTFAAFAIIAVGVGFLSGKTTWVALISIALGIAAIFGAPTIIKAITGEEICATNG